MPRLSSEDILGDTAHQTVAEGVVAESVVGQVENAHLNP